MLCNRIEILITAPTTFELNYLLKIMKMHHIIGKWTQRIDRESERECIYGKWELLVLIGIANKN